MEDMEDNDDNSDKSLKIIFIVLLTGLLVLPTSIVEYSCLKGNEIDFNNLVKLF